MEGMQQIGRLAMREIKGNWVAYWAQNESLKDAVFLASIRMGAVRENPERKEEFMRLARGIVSDILEAETGIRPAWGGPITAPEKERF